MQWNMLIIFILFVVFFFFTLLFFKWHARQQMTCTKLKEEVKKSETQEVKLLRWWFGWFKMLYEQRKKNA